MIKADLVEKVARELSLPKQTAEEGVNIFFQTIKKALLNGERVEIRGFGSFHWRQRRSRLGRNPRTGSPVKVPAKKVLHFKPSRLLTEIINKK